jgi:hypothetical protein
VGFQVLWKENSKTLRVSLKSLNKTGGKLTSKCFVINEWVLHDLRGENGKKAQTESIKFLETLKERCDQIAVLRGSRWMEKAYELMKYDHPFIRGFSKYLHQVILRDPKKCYFLDENDITAISEDLCKQVPNEDLYLIQIYFSTNAAALVTTDEKLYAGASKASDVHINVKLRQDFLKDYIGGK